VGVLLLKKLIGVLVVSAMFLVNGVYAAGSTERDTVSQNADTSIHSDNLKRMHHVLINGKEIIRSHNPERILHYVRNNLGMEKQEMS
jgi:hypothetical protein